MSQESAFNVSATEHGLLRAFVLEEADQSELNITEALGLLGMGISIDVSKTELIKVSDLKPLTFSEYLAEGYGIRSDEIAAKQNELDRIEARILLVPSSAFSGRAQVLEPKLPLRFLGLFREVSAATPEGMSTPDSAKGEVNINASSSSDGLQPARRGSIVIASLLLAAALIAILVFLNGS